MRYRMKSGVLFLPGSGERCAQIKSAFWGARRSISLADGGAQYQTDIDLLEAPAGRSGDVRYHVYTLKDGDGEVLMQARPGYAVEDDPDLVGWPICRVPRVDHADVSLEGSAYSLVMHNSQNYSLQGESGPATLRIMHEGISGGWTMEAARAFAPQVLCGLFIFCRYMEQENEFIVV